MERKTLRDPVLEAAAPVKAKIELRRADDLQEIRHLLWVGKDLPVERARVPADQDIADIEDDRVGCAWHDGSFR